MSDDGLQPRVADARRFVSRGGLKLEHALRSFALEVHGLVCADLGCNTGGFVDCLLQHGATKVFAVDTGYGVLDWSLRKDSRVVVMERTNAMHVMLPEPVDLVSIDVAWTRQKHILPGAARLLKPDGFVVALIKPHYEASASQLVRGILQPEHLAGVLAGVDEDIIAAGFETLAMTESPICGSKGNREVLALLRRAR
jgi:23S rRNA (cytidine1920-2'-O)/16S rRNA (cytidine1409-2'-O)-methyltransferase